MVNLRTKKTQKKYTEYLEKGYDGACIFCKRQKMVKEFDFWILTKNEFPYDEIAEKHTMLAPKRHIEEENELNQQEREDLSQLLLELDYDMCILNKKKKRSIPEHYHLHLLKFKD